MDGSTTSKTVLSTLRKLAVFMTVITVLTVLLSATAIATRMLTNSLCANCRRMN